MAESPRNTTRQREAGAASRQETRRRLLAAAAVEFAEGGYTKATVNRIASRAGVTVPTLYLSWGSKRELLRAYMESALGGEPDTLFGARLPHLIETALADTAGDPRALLRQIAHLFVQIAERSALGWQLYRDAAGSDPAVAQDWQTLQRLRRETFSNLIARLPPKSLRPGLTRAAAAETAWVIVSPETYELLVRTAGQSLDSYERWLVKTLIAALLPDGPPA